MGTIYNPIAFPGITYASTEKLEDLLKQNHAFHIYFDGIKHNHIAHNLIAIYTLGASPGELQAVFDKHSKKQKPLLQRKLKNPTHDLEDPKLFATHMGDGTYYSDYLAFFDYEIQKNGVLATFQTYYCRDDTIGARMRLQSMSAVLHGLIHVGYGIEIQHPLIMAEGLALCAVERSDYDPTTAAFTDILFKTDMGDTGTLMSNNSLLDVFQQLYASRDLLVPGSEFNYAHDIAFIGTAEKSSIIEALCSKWQVNATVADIKAKLIELLEMAFTLYSTTMSEYPAPHFDFFLMHTLTCGYFIPLVIAQFQDLNLQAIMLQASCRWFAAQYILSGLPRINHERLLKSIPPHALTLDFSWSKIIDDAITDNDEHVAKAIRSLIKLDIVTGKEKQQNPFLRLAQMTVGFRKLQDDTATMAWLMTGIGYEK